MRLRLPLRPIRDLFGAMTVAACVVLVLMLFFHAQRTHSEIHRGELRAQLRAAEQIAEFERLLRAEIVENDRQTDAQHARLLANIQKLLNRPQTFVIRRVIAPDRIIVTRVVERCELPNGRPCP